MRVSELYGGPGIVQGEGALLGVAMPFLRLAGCNLACAWCDSKYTWQHGYTYTEMTPEDAAAGLLYLTPAEALVRGGAWVSVTGGEPTLYARDVTRLCALLGDAGVRAIIETNGLRVIAAFAFANVFVSCSPKLPASGQDTPQRRARVARLVTARNASAALRTRTQYKFVVANADDLAALPDYCAAVGIDTSGAPGVSPVYVQPDGYTEPLAAYLTQLNWLQRAVREVAPGVRVTPQVHRLIHGANARGV